MNSIQQIDYWWCSGPWTSEKIEAVNRGYNHIYVKELDGRYRCLSNRSQFYHATELIIRKSFFEGGVMSTIEPHDGGPKGTLMEYGTTY